MTEYWTDFVQESSDRITELNNALLTLERNPDDPDAMEEVFRIAHTLKGNCGAAGLESASELAHAIEDLLDAVRSGRLEVSPELMDDIFDAVDGLETMIESVDETGSVDTDPSASIQALRGHLEGPAPIEPPSDDELEDVLSRFEPPEGDQNAYFVRISVDESVVEGGNAGILVVEALIDAFDLIGTAPPRESIEANAYNGRFDAVFASAVTKAAIESGLEPVDEVAAFELVDVTDTFETVAARADTDDGFELGEPDDIDISPDEAQDLEVDELLGEFDRYDDLDELVEEVEDDEDLDAFDDMGKAGSFDDLLGSEDVDVEFDEEDIDDPDAVSDDGREADAAGTATAPDPATETATDAGESEPSPSTVDETGSPETEPTADSEPADDEPVDDAEAVFQELKDEVEMVGFDELQEELEELEFDEFDTDDEVGMDELLGDDVDDDGDDPFLVDESSEDGLDDEFDDLEDIDEVSDDELADAISPADDATDDASVDETATDESVTGSVAESDEIGDSDADPESMDDTADAVTDAIVADAIDGEETTAPESDGNAASTPVADDGDDAIDSGAATDTETETETAVSGLEEDEDEVEADEDERSSATTAADDAGAVDTGTTGTGTDETETGAAEADSAIDSPTDSTDEEIDGTDIESDDHSSDSSDADPAADSDAEAPSDSGADDFGTETGGFEPATDNLEADDGDAESAASQPAADTGEPSEPDHTDEIVDFSQFGSEIGASDAEPAMADADATDADDSEFRSDDDPAPSDQALGSHDAGTDEEVDVDADADEEVDTRREVSDTDTGTADDSDLEPVTDTNTDTDTDPSDRMESVHASDSEPAAADSTEQSDPDVAEPVDDDEFGAVDDDDEFETVDDDDEFETVDDDDEFETVDDDVEFDSVSAAGEGQDEDESSTDLEDLETPDSNDPQPSDEGSASVDTPAAETADVEPATNDASLDDDASFGDDADDVSFSDDAIDESALNDDSFDDDSFDDLETETELGDSLGFDETDDSFDDSVGDDAFSDPGAGADDFEDIDVDAAADFETEPGPPDSFGDATAPADDGFSTTETTDTDDGFGTESDDSTDETSDRIVDEPNLEIPDISLPDDEDDRDAADETDEMQSVRVDVEQIDDLLTLVEGLVTSRVRLRHAVESGEDRQALETELDALEDLTTELQDTVMEVRLVPLETVTNRLPRVVRDISRDQGKEVALEMQGEDVELDRTILDRISDPLIHLVRNAVDHGIEPPERREEADKAREGTVEVTATRSRDRVTITVEDDGSGIDPDWLRSEAVDEGIISADEAEQLSDEQVYDLAFHPGFSTADEVTDVSGRGVGMDVVKRTVTELDGSVSIDSTPGDGTTITMTLPVSIAIDDILFVENGDREFGLPTEVVHDVESARAIEMVDGEPVLPTDDDTDDIPVVRLGDELETAATDSAEETDGVVVRIREDVRRVALQCDQVHGQQEVVVKPFDGFMSGIPGLSGATVRGRGKVVNIIDVTTL